MEACNEREILRQKIVDLEKRLAFLSSALTIPSKCDPLPDRNLTKEEINRYGRQLLLPDIGIDGQMKLVRASVLFVGAGGLSSPATFYLAGAGVGRIGIVDNDTVELNNLHRQIIHTEAREGTSKAYSAGETIQRFNSNTDCVVYNVRLNSTNALEIIKHYDVVLDCSDNVPTRYLVNDACVLLKKPLVSGSAMGMDGQVTVYNFGSGPCYRCIYPKPPQPETVGNCANNGVLGVVPGIIGSIQALECIKIIVGCGSVISQKLVLFNALKMQFHTIMLPEKKPQCEVCGSNPKITDLFADYAVSTGCRSDDKILVPHLLGPNELVSVVEYQKIQNSQTKHFLLDVRQPHQFKICSLAHACNIPLDKIESNINFIKEKIDDQNKEQLPCYVICRRGIDSQAAVKLLTSHGLKAQSITGGLLEWAKTVDTSFPIY